MNGDRIWETAIPKGDRNGNPWSDEQMNVLNDFAEMAFLAITGGNPVRIAIESVAGSVNHQWSMVALILSQT